jgi:ligand-binding sensor domain-containing protein/anti-sigma regulatory factor (Ser/Thr protein kinase)
MGSIRLILITVYCMCYCAGAFGQEPYYTVINKAKGLPSNSVYEIFQDSHGFIWIAGDEGLTRYDGYEFKTYKSARQTSRAGNGIAEDKYGRIWYKNFDGYLYYVENDTLKALEQHLTKGKAANGIIDDRLLVKSQNGIDFFDLATLKILKTIPFDNSYSTGDLNYKGHYYSVQEDAVTVFSANGHIENFKIKTNGTPYPSGNGIIIVHCDAYKTTCAEILNGKEVARPIAEDIHFVQGATYENGMHWFLTSEGMWGYDSSWVITNGGKPYFPTRNISCIMKDYEGNYWIGTLDEGILFVPDLNTKLISAPNFQPNVLNYINGKLYAGTKNNKVFEYEKEKGIYTLRFEVGQKHQVYCVAGNTVNKRFYIASRELYITDAHFKLIKSYPGGIKDIMNIDHKYAAYVSTGASGLIKLTDSGSSIWDNSFNASPRLAYDSIFSDFAKARGRGRSITYDAAANTIYMATSVGIIKASPQSIEEVKQNGASIYARKLDFFNNNLYILTQQNMLFILKNGQLQQWHPAIDEEPLLLRKTATNLYLVTTAGISYLDTATGNFPLLKLRIGMRSEEINDMEEIDNKLMIATDKGALLIDRYDTPAHSLPPTFRINTILVNGRKHSLNDIHTLSYKQTDIDVRYSILAFSTGNIYLLQYSINGGKWQSTESATRSLKLASLAPGKYNISFRLVSTNGQVYYQQPVLFSIRKPFWMLWWFWGLCFIVLAAAGYAYYKWQTSILRKKNALTIEKVELEKNLRNSMLTAIRAQMNPHFFYNALNTIQSFIFSDDKRNASTYLVKMSRLTRLILEMSEKEAITLDEEVEALKLYLELEQIRFGNDFKYEINVAANIDSEMVKIPSMIVQPYVENAIKHGLLHKQGLKKLVVDFSRVNSTLCATIDDNGVGRERAAEIKQPMKEKHQPFSTDANSKRIALLNRERDKSIGVIYLDKKDDNDTPQGTTVIISIPLV